MTRLFGLGKKENTGNIKIEKDVPFPLGICTFPYPFDNMEIGDSFVVPDETKASVMAAVTRYQKKCNWEKKFITRKDLNGRRVWRVI